MQKESKISAHSSINGPGVFAVKEIKRGEKIVDFYGPLVKLQDMPIPYDTVEDHYVQIGEKLYMGPSGKIDDFFNHSCNPNSGLVVEGMKAYLVAIRNIVEGEEVTWDYSTTMDEDDWVLDCHCGEKNCRKKIRDFKYLPKELQERYIALSIVPTYNLIYR